MTLQSLTPLSVLCPQCFGKNPRPKFGYISFDGNFQQKRFPTSRTADDTYLEYNDRRLFVDNNDLDEEVISFLSHTNLVQATSSHPTNTTCGQNFKAAAEKSVCQRMVDTGLMTAVCRCDVPLRLYNIHRTDERSVYVLRLLKSLLLDKDCPLKLMTLYDINCMFSKYIEVRLFALETLK